MATNSLFSITAHASSTVDIGHEVKGFFGFTCIGNFVSNIIGFAILIAAILVLVYFVWGGIQWITAGGDKGKTEEARNRLTNAVIGLAIVAASWAMWSILLTFFGIKGDVCNPGTSKQINRPSSPLSQNLPSSFVIPASVG